jgi:hypothetical protein
MIHFTGGDESKITLVPAEVIKNNSNNLELDHTVEEVAAGIILHREQNRLVKIDLVIAFLACCMIVLSLIEVPYLFLII